ncbi:MAG: hypothetical protein WCH01_20540 [Methylococcaceae bacterium]
MNVHSEVQQAEYGSGDSAPGEAKAYTPAPYSAFGGFKTERRR